MWKNGKWKRYCTICKPTYNDPFHLGRISEKRLNNIIKNNSNVPLNCLIVKSTTNTKVSDDKNFGYKDGEYYRIEGLEGIYNYLNGCVIRIHGIMSTDESNKYLFDGKIVSKPRGRSRRHLRNVTFFISETGIEFYFLKPLGGQ